MKRQKLTLKGVKNVLSRTEMRKIMAGSSTGGGGGNCGNPQVVPPAIFSCHDSTGFVLGTVSSNYCSANPCTLSLCQQKTAPEWTAYVTGPC